MGTEVVAARTAILAGVLAIAAVPAAAQEDQGGPSCPDNALVSIAEDVEMCFPTTEPVLYCLLGVEDTIDGRTVTVGSWERQGGEVVRLPNRGIDASGPFADGDVGQCWGLAS